MPRTPRGQSQGKQEGERSTRLRPGRVRRIDTSPPRVTGRQRICFVLSGLLAVRLRQVQEQDRPPGRRLSPGKTSAFQRRAIVNVRYSSSRTPGGWKAHGTYLERESAKGDRQQKEKETGLEYDLQSTRFRPPWLGSGTSARIIGRRLAASRRRAHFQDYRFPHGVFRKLQEANWASLLTVKTSAPAPFKPFFETTEGNMEIIRHDRTLGGWSRGDLAPGNVVTIDSLRSSPDKLYAALVGGDTDVLVDDKALGSSRAECATMGLAVSDSDKGWIGQFNAALRSRSGERMRKA